MPRWLARQVIGGRRPRPRGATGLQPMTDHRAWGQFYRQGKGTAAIRVGIRRMRAGCDAILALLMAVILAAENAGRPVSRLAQPRSALASQAGAVTAEAPLGTGSGLQPCAQVAPPPDDNRLIGRRAVGIKGRRAQAAGRACTPSRRASLSSAIAAAARALSSSIPEVGAEPRAHCHIEGACRLPTRHTNHCWPPGRLAPAGRISFHPGHRKRWRSDRHGHGPAGIGLGKRPGIAGLAAT